MIERFKEWIWAIIFAITVNGYISLDLTVMQRIMTVFMLWLVALCVIYKGEEIYEKYRTE